VGAGSMWPILGPRTCHAGVKPNPYTWGVHKPPNGKEPHAGLMGDPEITQWKRATCRKSVRKLGPRGLLAHVKTGVYL